MNGACGPEEKGWRERCNERLEGQAGINCGGYAHADYFPRYSALFKNNYSMLAFVFGAGFAFEMYVSLPSSALLVAQRGAPRGPPFTTSLLPLSRVGKYDANMGRV